MPLPSASALARSLSGLTEEVFWKDRWLLLAQYWAPDRTLAEDEFARATRRDKGLDAWLAYGRLAKRVGGGAGWRPPGRGVTWNAALSDTEEVGGRRCLRLRPEAAEALEQAGWVRGAAATEVEALRHAVDDLTQLVLFLVDEVVDVRADLEGDRAAARPSGQRFNWAEFEDRSRVAGVIRRMALDRAMADEVLSLVDHWTLD